MTVVDHKPITFTDTNGIHPIIGNLYNLGTKDLKWDNIYANNWKGGVIQPMYGGTGLTTVGNAGQVLTSNGVDKLPSWQSPGNNSKDFSLPKMTTSERNNIRNPGEGTMIYNTTTHKLNVFTGTVWEQIMSN
ncbi:MAG: hypothetical protein WDM90_08245 [Ferruginibacter sp.]